jgi:hypothetical protein
MRMEQDISLCQNNISSREVLKFQFNNLLGNHSKLKYCINHSVSINIVIIVFDSNYNDCVIVVATVGLMMIYAIFYPFYYLN